MPLCLLSAGSISAMTIRRPIALRTSSSTASRRSSLKNARCMMMSSSLAVTARSMRVLAAAGWAYRRPPDLRAAFEDTHFGYVLEVGRDQRIESKRADKHRDLVPNRGWQPRSQGPGAKGLRIIHARHGPPSTPASAGTAGGAARSSAATARTGTNTPTSYATTSAAPARPSSSRQPAAAGPWRNASRSSSQTPDTTSTRSAARSPDNATPSSPCSPQRSSPSPGRSCRQTPPPGRRDDPEYLQRDPQAPGNGRTPARTRETPPAALVTLAPTPPSLRRTLPPQATRRGRTPPRPHSQDQLKACCSTGTSPAEASVRADTSAIRRALRNLAFISPPQLD